MSQLTRADLWSLEEYAERRLDFRARVMRHKRCRQLELGDHARLYFEDALTIKYQIQEMLRIERVFEPAGIQEELDAYNPLIPDGDNWKATLMLEYDDPGERAERLRELVGIENRVWLKVGDCDLVYPIADEDLDRSDDHKTSSVHFLRFQLTPEMMLAASSGELIQAGIDHPGYPLEGFVIDEAVRRSLVGDLRASQLH